MKISLPKSKIFIVSDMLYSKVKAQIMILGQWLLTTHDRRKAYVPNPNSKRGSN